ncbi:high-affinity glucose transporter-4 [Elsinoe australis]|uniref:High-affinity glucose transporter-4 n=1 Tax=Elsinoe australis TaxID=40998 RepID=A0A4U7APB2_9PEZI|nr:high-affinity glucose transporter-4 [Elsinoe australis]
MSGNKWLIYGIASIAALGGFIYGVDSGIIATTLGHDTFKVYMFGPARANASLTGAIVSTYNAGQAVGALSTGWLADKFSRRWTIFLSGVLAILGAALQAGAVNVEMLIVGRTIAGIGCGMILSAVPIYLAEITPPKQRGFVVGLQGVAISLGFMAANWIGYGGAFAVGDVQWRVPLAMQIPGPILLVIGCFFIPYSPRWLSKNERYEEAERVLHKLHGKGLTDLVQQEMIQIRDQIAFENSQQSPGWIAAVGRLFSRRYLRRTMTATFIITMGQLSGSSVIQNYQNIFYATVGFTGNTSLLISGIYGFMGVIGEIIYSLFVADKWPRTTTLWSGSLVLSTLIAICMALSAQFGVRGSNPDGARAAIAFIFIYSASYAVFFNSMIYVVPSELFPYSLRSKGLAFAVFVKAIAAIVLSQITPVAIQQVGWRYYSLFIATNAAAAVIYFFFLPETGHKSLEEIAELFGDTLATEHIGEIDVDEKGGRLSIEKNEGLDVNTTRRSEA